MKRYKKIIACLGLGILLAVSGCKNAAGEPETDVPEITESVTPTETATPTEAINEDDTADKADAAENENDVADKADAASKEDIVKEEDSRNDAELYAALFDGLERAKSDKSVLYNNPLMTQRFGADPYAMVYDGRVYIYMTADAYEYNEDGSIGTNTYSQIKSINVISSDDLVNWTDHGCVYAAGRDGAATWAGNSWAPAACWKMVDGEPKFFLYFANSAGGIAVLTADSPTGRFTDPIGGPLISKSTPTCDTVTWLFDPAVLVEDDGSAYLYFGGGIPDGMEEAPGTARVVKLGEDMISLDGDPVMIDVPYLFEDSGINKIGDTYYYSYCSNWNVTAEAKKELGIASAQICYMTSDSPMGPFTLQGVVLPNPGDTFGVWGNNHHCIFQFEEEWYIAYHAELLAKNMDVSGGYRSTHIDKITIQEDGSIAKASCTQNGVKQVKLLNPYEETEAETIAVLAGVNTTQYGARSVWFGCGNMAVCDMDSGDWLCVKGVDFGEQGATEFFAAICAAEDTDGVIEIRTDRLYGEVVGYLKIPAGNGTDCEKLQCELLSTVTGVHDLYFTFYGSNYLWDSWVFQ